MIDENDLSFVHTANNFDDLSNSKFTMMMGLPPGDYKKSSYILVVSPVWDKSALPNTDYRKCLIKINSPVEITPMPLTND